MGENASTTDSSTTDSDSKSSDTTKSKSGSESSRDVRRSRASPSDGPDLTGPLGPGVDRMAAQRRKQTERSLGPATVRRMESDGQLDADPSGVTAEAQRVVEGSSPDTGSGGGSGEGTTGSVDAGEAVQRAIDSVSGPSSPEVHRKAQTVADSVSGGSDGSAPVQRSAEAGAEADTGDGGEGGASSLVQDVVSSSGGSLDPGIRGELGSKMGADFGDVRVHTGPTASKAAEAINAKAFTVGNHIGFNRGVYDPSSQEGKHTLAHELAHVQQQADQTRRMVQRIQEGGGMEVSDPGDPHEKEAESVARAVMRGESATVSPMSAGAGTVSPRVDRFLGGGDAAVEEEVKSLQQRLDQLEKQAITRDQVPGAGGGGGGGTQTSQSPDGGGQADQADGGQQDDGGGGGIRGWVSDKAQGVKETAAGMGEAAFGESTADIAKELVGKFGKQAGAQGGKSVGALLGGAAGSMLLPGVGTAAGAAAGATAGEFIGGAVGKGTATGIAGTAASEGAEKVTGGQEQNVEALNEKIQQLEEKVNKLDEEEDTAMGQSGQL